MSRSKDLIQFYICACAGGLIVQQCIPCANVPVLIISTEMQFIVFFVTGIGVIALHSRIILCLMPFIFVLCNSKYNHHTVRVSPYACLLVHFALFTLCGFVCAPVSKRPDVCMGGSAPVISSKPQWSPSPAPSPRCLTCSEEKSCSPLPLLPVLQLEE